ncbi:MAG TPA: hypothetical protein VD993_02450 [Chitinophagaceae bacterium]|nr:hypothetical protein [Chitinophagaceae bacterium]
MLLSDQDLFLSVMQDLRNRVSAGKVYDMIKACGLCRHLIADKHPLAHAVNRDHKIELVFTVVDWDSFPLSKIRMDIKWFTISPNTMLERETVGLSLKQFLAHKLLGFHQFDFTVCDVIRNVSHLMGGVHSGPPYGVEERAFLAFQRAIKETDPPLIVYAITAICEVVIKGLEPLESAIAGAPLRGGIEPQS